MSGNGVEALDWTASSSRPSRSTPRRPLTLTSSVHPQIAKARGSHSTRSQPGAKCTLDEGSGGWRGGGGRARVRRRRPGRAIEGRRHCFRAQPWAVSSRLRTTRSAASIFAEAACHADAIEERASRMAVADPILRALWISSRLLGQGRALRYDRTVASGLSSITSTKAGGTPRGSRLGVATRLLHGPRGSGLEVGEDVRRWHAKKEILLAAEVLVRSPHADSPACSATAWVVVSETGATSWKSWHGRRQDLGPSAAGIRSAFALGSRPAPFPRFELTC